MTGGEKVAIGAVLVLGVLGFSYWLYESGNLASLGIGTVPVATGTTKSGTTVTVAQNTTTAGETDSLTYGNGFSTPYALTPQQQLANLAPFLAGKL